jgi:hypothetical protein
VQLKKTNTLDRILFEDWCWSRKFELSLGAEKRRIELLRGVDLQGGGMIELQRQLDQSLIISVQAYSHPVSSPPIITSTFSIFFNGIGKCLVQDTRN